MERATSTVILDRDGVINVDTSAHVRSVAEWRPLPGSLEAMAALHRAGFELLVASNQSGVARGLFSLRELAAIHAHMRRQVRAAGGEPVLVRTGKGHMTEAEGELGGAPVFDDLAAFARSLLGGACAR